jgi:hypothetical protein
LTAFLEESRNPFVKTFKELESCDTEEMLRSDSFDAAAFAGEPPFPNLSLLGDNDEANRSASVLL